jgi:hypothetical protein
MKSMIRKILNFRIVVIYFTFLTISDKELAAQNFETKLLIKMCDYLKNVKRCAYLQEQISITREIFNPQTGEIKVKVTQAEYDSILLKNGLGRLEADSIHKMSFPFKDYNFKKVCIIDSCRVIREPIDTVFNDMPFCIVRKEPENIDSL